MLCGMDFMSMAERSEEVEKWQIKKAGIVKVITIFKYLKKFSLIMAKDVLFYIFIVLVLSASVLATPPSIPELPVDSNLYFSTIPSINSPTDLIFEFTAKEDLNQLTAQISLDTSSFYFEDLTNRFNLVDGLLEWKGNLRKGETIKLIAKVIGNDEGYYRIHSSIFGATQNSMGKGNELIVKLLRDGRGEILEKFPKNGWQTHCGSGVGLYTEALDLDYDLKFTSFPQLGQKTGIILSVIPKDDLSDVNINLRFPPIGFKVISAEVSKPQKFSERNGEISINDIDKKCPAEIYWFGDLKRGEPLEIKVGAKIKEQGWGSLLLGLDSSGKGISISNFVLVDTVFSKTDVNICSSNECVLFEQALELKEEESENFFTKIIEFFRSLFS